MRIVRLCASVLIAGALGAQRGGPPAGVELGARLYRTNCAVCHGPDGDTVAGVDLWSGKFRRVSSDGELIGIMRNGNL